MRRRRSRKPGISLSLFPFLAVLICTMGSLIVLLVIMVQQARVVASEVEQQQAEKAEQQRQLMTELDHKIEDADWRHDILNKQREELLDQLEQRRRRIGYLEDTINTAKEKLSLLIAQAKSLQDQGNAGSGETSQINQQIAQLRLQIENESRALEIARKAAASKPASYAIVMHRTFSGTNRRPVFLECTANAVIIQPENIVLVAGDFQPPLVQGNPLDAALKAVRIYWAKYGQEDEREPYPLLLVRPGGATSYTAARAAMQFWDDRFGYELIDEEMQLEYPAADPALRALLQETVTKARRRMALLAAAQPQRYKGNGGLRASRSGGFINDDGESATRTFASGERKPGQPFAFQPGETPPHQQTADRRLNGSTQKQPAAGATASQPGGQPQPLSATRGQNWGLPNAAGGATAITRPIRVVVMRDRITLLPEVAGEFSPRPVPFEGDTRAAVDEFVSQVWDFMKRWGTAGNRAYWRPILSVEVAPGGAQRFADLESLLKGSGLIVERKQP